MSCTVAEPPDLMKGSRVVGCSSVESMGVQVSVFFCISFYTTTRTLDVITL
mgnify:CR=1 FL=1